MQVYPQTGTVVEIEGIRSSGSAVGGQPVRLRQHDRRLTDSHAPNSFRVDIRDSGSGHSRQSICTASLRSIPRIPEVKTGPVVAWDSPFAN